MPDKPDPKRPFRGGMRMGRGELNGQGIKLSFLANALSDQVGRKVIDETGLKDDYSFELKWTPDESHDQDSRVVVPETPHLRRIPTVPPFLQQSKSNWGSNWSRRRAPSTCW